MKFKKFDEVVEIAWPYKVGVIEEARKDESEIFQTGEFYMVRFSEDVVASGGEDIKLIELQSTELPS